MRNLLLLHCGFVLGACCTGQAWAQDEHSFIEVAADQLEDKIRGGMLAQVIGNLNGLPHEFKYIAEPGNVEQYTPGLPDGARTDDDTDLEWVYLRAIAQSRRPLLPSDKIASLWKAHINRSIWCANLYARQLMDLGIEPPWTGNPVLNPWSDFNISGQFICESFGLMAPAMPQTAARIGLNYTHVTIDGEPAQTTQFFTTMIAMAFVESDLERLLDAGEAAVDPQSEIAAISREVRELCRMYPDDWRSTRRAIKERWQTQGGILRERNGYELNTACTIAALVYGKKDFVETLRIAFNLGWDCDNNAATAATILGVIHGRRWMNEQGWEIADIYRNTTRDGLPENEMLTGLEDTVIQCARVVIEGQGGELRESGDRRVYRIRVQPPGNVEPLSTPAEQEARLRQTWLPRLDADLLIAGAPRARAAYIAVCLGEAERLQKKSPAAWTAAIEELQAYPALVAELFEAPEPTGDKLRRAAEQAGLQPPAK